MAPYTTFPQQINAILATVHGEVISYINPILPGGSKIQMTFHRSLVAGHCFTFSKVTKILNLADPRPKIGFLGLGLAKLRVLGYSQKGKTMTCNE